MPAAVQSQAGCLIGRDYPAPIVDHATEYKAARERIYAVKARPETRRQAEKVFVKHGSRKGRRAVAS